MLSLLLVDDANPEADLMIDRGERSEETRTQRAREMAARAVSTCVVAVIIAVGVGIFP